MELRKLGDVKKKLKNRYDEFSKATGLSYAVIRNIHLGYTARPAYEDVVKIIEYLHLCEQDIANKYE